MWYQKSASCILFLIWLPFVLTFNDQNIPLVLSSKSSATTTAETLNTDTEPLVYYVCGPFNPTITECHCYNKNVQCFMSSWEAKPFKNANIEIMRPNFTAEFVYFGPQNFGILKKNETLPALARNVKYLRLVSSNITEIEDGTFDNFDALQSLSLSSNAITALTNKVLTQKLGTTLRDLDLSGNRNLKFSSIDFTCMANLKSLDLGDNYDFGKFFASSSWSFPTTLSNLTSLSLSRCNITNIPENVFVNLRHLSSLHLYNNPLTTYPKILNTIPTLRHLDLSSTHIKNLNQTMLGDNEHLNQLYIYSSIISSIDDCTFCGFTNLTSMLLSHSPLLSFIHENAFGHAKNGIEPKINYFSVEYSNLTVIPEKLLNWHNIKDIYLGGNPFNCSCEMAWLIEDILNPTFTMNLKNNAWYSSQNPLRCRYPWMLKNIPFIKLNQNYCKKPKPTQKPSRISGFVLFLIVMGFVAATILLCRYLFRLRKRKTVSKNGGVRTKIIKESFENENFDSNA